MSIPILAFIECIHKTERSPDFVTNIAVKGLAVLKEIALSPATMIYGGCDRVPFRRSGEHICDQRFVVSAKREVHAPSVVGAPMPVQHFLTVAGKPIPFDIIPNPADAV